MTLIRRNYTDWPSLSNLFDDFFSGDLTDSPVLKRQATMPSVNIAEFKDKFKIEVAAPGLNKEDFKLDLDNNVLTISSEKENKVEEKDGEYTKREFQYSSFKRSFTLPDSAEADKISAKYENGVLDIEIGKKDAAVIKPKKSIEIS
jgi:HSP20 family protein